ncbi:MAG: tetratricopeptide repeat protein [Stappiaceae bacterium]
MFKIALLLALAGTCQSALALECPAVPDNVMEKDRLHAELLTTQTEMSGHAVSGQLWTIWTTAPDEASQELLDRGRERIRVADYEGAEQYFSDLVEYCPHYAEGWNQRAYAHHLRQDYDASLDDINQALELEPRHFGALAGRAITLISMGRTKIGHNALRKALEINPWLSERHLLPPGEESGKDI